MKRQFLRAAAGVCLLTVAVPQGTTQQNQAVVDPLELFTKMMPVFKHPRCANCHGAVDPFIDDAGPTGEWHDGGMVGSPTSPRPLRAALCAECHKSSQAIIDKWITPFRPMTFHDKDATTLCKMQDAEVDHMGRYKYMLHLIDDPLITDAFTGEVGGTRAPAPPVKPPMERKDFLAAAKSWLDAGAGCGVWSGKITQTESFVSNYGFPIAGGTHSVTESARRVVELNRNNAAATAKIETTGHAVQQLVSHSGGCTTTITNKQEWSDKAFAGSKPAVIRFEIAPDGSYLIRFKGPPEKTHTSDFGTHISSCGSLPQPLPGGANLDWDPWKFSIRCPPTPDINTARGESIVCNRFDAEKSPRLKGEMTRVIVDHWDAAERQSWLTVSPAGISRADTGESLPVTVFTKWDFVLVE